MRPPPLLLCAALLAPTGCAASTHSADAPVPASEPRAILRLRVDLVRAQDCEEAFDLAMYKSRAVELVEWDDAHGRCTDRAVTIRYLTQKASREDVLRAAGSLAAKIAETNGDSR